MCGMDFLTQPQIDLIVLDLPIFPALGNGEAQGVDFGPQVSENWGFSPLNFFGARMNTHIGDQIFQDTPRRVAKLRKNRPRDVEKSVVGKKKTKLECGPMPSVMAALPNIDGALCSTPQSLAEAQYWSAVQ